MYYVPKMNTNSTAYMRMMHVDRNIAALSNENSISYASLKQIGSKEYWWGARKYGLS